MAYMVWHSGTLIPAVIVQGFVQPLVVCRLLRISLNTFCRQVLIRPSLVGLVLAIFLFLGTGVFRPDTWLTLFAAGTVSLAIAFVVATLVGLSKSERDVAIVRPIQVVFTKVKGTAFGKIADNRAA